jgi:hypothetical protein
MYKMLEAVGFDPQTSPPHSAFTNSNNQLSRRCSLLWKSMRIYLNLCVVLIGKGGRPGLSPDPWFHCKLCDHMVYGAVLTNCAWSKPYSPWTIVICVNTFVQGFSTITHGFVRMVVTFAWGLAHGSFTLHMTPRWSVGGVTQLCN